MQCNSYQQRNKCNVVKKYLLKQIKKFKSKPLASGRKDCPRLECSVLGWRFWPPWPRRTLVPHEVRCRASERFEAPGPAAGCAARGRLQPPPLLSFLQIRECDIFGQLSGERKSRIHSLFASPRRKIIGLLATAPLASRAKEYGRAEK